MDPEKLIEIHTNIPHMHLFLELKRKFPELRDGHITDCIQRFGLDKDRCEEELTNKMQEQHRVYYSPRGGQSRPGSLTSTGGQNSPLSPSMNPTLTGQTLLHFGSSSMTPGNVPLSVSHMPENVFVGTNANIPHSMTTQSPNNLPHSQPLHPTPLQACSFSIPTRNSDITPIYSSSSNFTPSTTDMYFQPIQRPIFEHSPNQHHNSSTEMVPRSAPVIHQSNDPFEYEPARRSSAEGINERRRVIGTPQVQGELLPFPSHYYPANSNVFIDKTKVPLTNLSHSIPFSVSQSDTNSTLINMNPAHSSCSSNRKNKASFQTSSAKHKTSLHLVPSLPHGAHHNPVPSSEEGKVCVSGRSYTSVNLQLRHPSSEPQSPINIGNNVSSLTYSTSSLNRNQGLRSSLQISIGPLGGSISAMRTNYQSDDKANTAFQVQYSNSHSSPASPVHTYSKPCLTCHCKEQPCNAEAPLRPISRNVKSRPQTWYKSESVESTESLPEARLRRTSLPEAISAPLPSLPHCHQFYFPPCSCPSFSGPPCSSSCNVAQNWSSSSTVNVQDMVNLQLEKKFKLQTELTKRLEEKNTLEDEIKILKLDIEKKEKFQRADIDTYKKKTDDLYQDNMRIQSECYEMFREILALGENPHTEEDLSSFHASVSPPSTFSESIPMSPSMSRGSSGSSIGSGFTSPTTPINPQRAPSPPPYIVHRSPNNSPGVPLHHPTTFSIPSQRMDGTIPNVAGAGVGVAKEDNDRQWACSKCTFKNSSFLNECEMCGMPHFPVGTAPPSQSLAHSTAAGAPCPPGSSFPRAGESGICYCHRHRHNFNTGRDTHGSVRDI